MKKTKESGRSMVEMLGVLAIIGVLSVGGIAGYTTAMNKHRANQILNGASVRAIVVSTQIQRGSEAPTLGEFTEANNAVGGATFTGLAAWNKNTDKRFSLTLTGVDEKICTQMKAMVGQNGIIREINEGCTTITYNNDLSPNDPEPSGATCPEGTSENGAGGFAKNVDTIQCYCNGENEKWSGSACDGTLPEGTCSDNTDCKKGEYCNYYDYNSEGYPYDLGDLRSGDCRNGPNANSGICLTADTDSGTNDYGFTLSGNYMDWFSAKNFCESLNKTMVGLEDTDCTTSDCEWTKISTGNLDLTWWWTKYLPPSDSCKAFFVGTANNGLGGIDRNDSLYPPCFALCK